MNEQDSHCSVAQVSRQASAAFLAGALLVFGSGANAILLKSIPPDLVVSGASLELFARTAEGNFTQTGDLHATQGGLISSIPVTTAGASPAGTTTLTATGDRLGARFSLDANSIKDVFEFDLGDPGIALDFANNSGTDTIEITLRVAYNGSIKVDDHDAYAYVGIALRRGRLSI